MSVLIIGIGNPGRCDDAIGPELVEMLENKVPGFVECTADYQLNIEDAEDLAKVELAIFIDASMESAEPFGFYALEPSAEITFTTHTLSAESLLALAKSTFGNAPESFMLGVKGYEFEIGEGLSEKAQMNRDKAYEFISGLLADSAGETAERCRKSVTQP